MLAAVVVVQMQAAEETIRLADLAAERLGATQIAEQIPILRYQQQ